MERRDTDSNNVAVELKEELKVVEDRIGRQLEGNMGLNVLGTTTNDHDDGGGECGLNQGDNDSITGINNGFSKNFCLMLNTSHTVILISLNLNKLKYKGKREYV